MHSLLFCWDLVFPPAGHDSSLASPRSRWIRDHQAEGLFFPPARTTLEPNSGLFSRLSSLCPGLCSRLLKAVLGSEPTPSCSSTGIFPNGPSHPAWRENDPSPPIAGLVKSLSTLGAFFSLMSFFQKLHSPFVSTVSTLTPRPGRALAHPSSSVFCFKLCMIAPFPLLSTANQA